MKIRFVHEHTTGDVAIYTDERPAPTTTLLGWIMNEDNGFRLIDVVTNNALTGATFGTKDEAIEFARNNLKVSA